MSRWNPETGVWVKVKPTPLLRLREAVREVMKRNRGFVFDVEKFNEQVLARKELYIAIELNCASLSGNSKKAFIERALYDLNKQIESARRGQWTGSYDWGAWEIQMKSEFGEPMTNIRDKFRKAGLYSEYMDHAKALAQLDTNPIGKGKELNFWMNNRTAHMRYIVMANGSLKCFAHCA